MINFDGSAAPTNRHSLLRSIVETQVSCTGRLRADATAKIQSDMVNRNQIGVRPEQGLCLCFRSLMEHDPENRCTLFRIMLQEQLPGRPISSTIR